LLYHIPTKIVAIRKEQPFELSDEVLSLCVDMKSTIFHKNIVKIALLIFEIINKVVFELKVKEGFSIALTSEDQFEHL